MSGLLLAGGHSRRMGMDKAGIVWRGETFATWVAGALSAVADDVTATRRPGQAPLPNVRTVYDERPDGGPLAGLEAGFKVARHEWVLVAPVDTPGLCAPLLGLLVCAALEQEEAEAVMPVCAGYRQPLVAVYRRSLLGSLRCMLDAGHLRVLDFVARLSVRLLDEDEWRMSDPEGLSFAPFHTPHDLRRRKEEG